MSTEGGPDINGAPKLEVKKRPQRREFFAVAKAESPRESGLKKLGNALQLQDRTPRGNSHLSLSDQRKESYRAFVSKIPKFVRYMIVAGVALGVGLFVGTGFLFALGLGSLAGAAAGVFVGTIAAAALFPFGN